MNRQQTTDEPWRNTNGGGTQAADEEKQKGRKEGKSREKRMTDRKNIEASKERERKEKQKETKKK